MAVGDVFGAITLAGITCGSGGSAHGMATAHPATTGATHATTGVTHATTHPATAGIATGHGTTAGMATAHPGSTAGHGTTTHFHSRV